MLSCSECVDDSCPEQGRDMNAPDECYTNDKEGVGASAPAPSPTELDGLRDVVIGYGVRLALLEARQEDLELRFNTVMSAIIRAIDSSKEER